MGVDPTRRPAHACQPDAMHGPKTIHLVRHGQSELNASVPTDGPETARLTAIGERQAQAIAASFDHAPELIVVSSFRRARETAAATHARFPGARLEVWPVEEFHYLGATAYRGTTKRDRRPDVAAYWQACDPAYVGESGAESFVAFLARVQSVRERLERAPERRIAVFSHKKLLHALMWSWREGPPAADREGMARFRTYDRGEAFPNGSCVEVVLTGGVARVGDPRAHALPEDAA